MQLITYFAPKGGAGRTIAMMTTASSLVAAGHSVAVLDLSEQAQPGWIFGPSDISRWEARMFDTGAEVGRFVTAPAIDQETAMAALERFHREKFDFVLVDTAKNPNPTTISIMNQSDLVIVPMRGPHEATWSSNWFAANRYPVGRIYGLVTGAFDRDDERLARATLTGMPMLLASLPLLFTLGAQFKTGLLHAKRFFEGGVADDDHEEYMELSHDWIAAYSAADRMCSEIKRLLQGQTYPPYAVNTPLASGSTFAHLHAVLKQPTYCSTSA